MQFVSTQKTSTFGVKQGIIVQKHCCTLRMAQSHMDFDMSNMIIEFSARTVTPEAVFVVAKCDENEKPDVPHVHLPCSKYVLGRNVPWAPT